YPEKLKISQSMKQVIKRDKYQFTSDTAFDQVIHHCARAKRKGTDQTWIDENFIHAYSLMHQIGLAHSFEAWWNGKLVGGLYGLAIGEVFFGESMFSYESNASKAAFIQGVQFLRLHQFKMIDCQTPTDHLRSLGAEPVSRDKFLHDLHFDVLPPALNKKNWAFIFQIFLAR
ncbi:MAG: leucyl/phenylalanyl-tRNA--protein transferase, partial [Saprospiraceae bacterium]